MDDSTTLVAVSAALQTTATVTPVSLAVPAGTTYQDWERLGAGLKTLAGWSPWAIGDWYLAGERLFGEEAAQAVTDLGLDIHTVQNYAWVCGCFPLERRRLELSFAHHAETAALETADEWLQYAIDNDLSRAQLRAEIRAVRRQEAAEETSGVIQLPPPLSGRGLVEVNGGLAYIGLTAVGDLLAAFEGCEVEYTFKPVAVIDAGEAATQEA